ncbi:morphogenic membrane protein MmpA [Streptomyces parvulus]
MTTHRTSQYRAPADRTVGRAAVAGLALAAVAGLAWVGGMICTIVAWAG